MWPDTVPTVPSCSLSALPTLNFSFYFCRKNICVYFYFIQRLIKSGKRDVIRCKGRGFLKIWSTCLKVFDKVCNKALFKGNGALKTILFYWIKMDKWRRNDNNYASLRHDETTAPKSRCNAWNTDMESRYRNMYFLNDLKNFTARLIQIQKFGGWRCYATCC